MKVIHFKPHPWSLDSGAPPRSRRPAAGEGGFAAHLKNAGLAEADSLVSQENQRALRLPPALDLSQADRLMSRLSRTIRAASPETLRRVHALEGLLCLYRQTDGL